MRLSRSGFALFALWVVGCNSPQPSPADLRMVTEMPSAADAGRQETPDLVGAMCTRCDAVLNPCPALGLDCNAAIGCCGPKAVSCVPLHRQCLVPAICCAGLSCVSGACAKVEP